MTILVSINPKEKTCRRYSGKTMTHGFMIDTAITPEMIEAMLKFPDTVGVPENEPPLEAA